jgi:signal transduction histidine kinase
MLLETEELIKFLAALIASIFGVVILITSIVILFIKKEKKHKINFEIFKSNQEKEILKTQLEIQEETFKKISREIHDNISLGLTLAKLQVNNYIDFNKTKNELLTSTVDLISKSLVDLNDISKSLDANQLLSHGFINALESEISVLRRSGIYTIDLNVEGEPEYLEAESELILLRIFQEACNNTIKHSKANTILVNLIYGKKSIELSIKDNGIGFDVNKVRNTKDVRKMSGLNNFVKRADVIGAKVNIESIPGKGTTITIKKEK